ncbi:MAG: CBS domain-containing protein [Proteobacteria bacterium]|nr:CBS domain-containing protein [Desulfobacula sp.]MBU3952051.1 CBS domain-containing protein [Pseudomonadota bacterium]MBU4131831.1 CBS domain-containing protein [Pseudomonadota bacterium]
MRKTNKTILAKTIITSHVNADFDAIGAMLAAQKLYPDAVIIFPGSQEKSLRDFFISSMSYLFNMANPALIDFSDTTTLILVDTRQASRLTGISELLEKKGIRIEIYDHHPPMPGDIRGDVDISKEYGATTTILSEIIQKQQIPLTPEEATVMALGIYEDTGLFTFSSTTPADFIQAGFLLACGASLNTIASLVVKEIKAEQVTWLNELLNEMTVHRINGLDVNISTISSPSYIEDLASIVQKIVRMENLDIFFAIVLMGTKINIIARNRIPEVDVGRIMSEFGGGGHAYAASAKIDNQTLPQVEMMLLDKLKQEVKSVQVAKSLMSSPAITIDPYETCKDAGKIMTRYNVNSLLVVDKTTNSYEGYITRQVVEKLLFHKLSGQPVCEYMNSETHFVSSDADVAEIELKIIEGKQRIIPVIDDNHIKGVITRTDLLNYLVQHNWEVTHTESQVSQTEHVKKRHIGNILENRLAVQTKKLLKSISNAGKELGVSLYVVGGFVRDLLLDRGIEDIDIVVEGDGIAFAKFYANQHGCRVNTHKKFGTAVIVFPDNFKVDVASARLEYYDTPAALPIVENSSIKKDLARRDFTINTLALSLDPDNFGTLIDYFGATRDLKDKTIRTIHNLSFVEDPTRIFRAIKFANRFGFNIGKVTATLIKNAVKIDCFKNLSGLRVLSELKQIFGEENPIPAIHTMESYGLEKVLHSQLMITPTTYLLFESVKKALTWHDLLYIDEEYPRWAVYFMALFNRCSHLVCEQICDRLMVPVRERSLLLEKRYKAENRLALIETAYPLTRQELYWGLIPFKTEFILYMMALTKNEAVRKAISNFYTRYRYIKPLISGKDLLKIGIKPGPVYTKILNLILNEKLDNKLETPKKEIKFATQYARENKLID